MNSLRLFVSRARAGVLAFGLLAAAALPTLLPTYVSADQLSERSIELSSSSAGAEGVTYIVTFTPKAAAGAFVIDFCSNSPILGQSCTAPTGFDITEASSATAGFTTVAPLEGSSNALMVTGTLAEDTEVVVSLDDIVNPSSDGVMYARIVTYDTALNAAEYTSTTVARGTGGVIDDGTVAISITDTIGVSGAVLESMTFCVSGSAITADCGSTTSPVLRLGETSGGVVALTPGVISTGSIYTQITTNAASGAVVSLKSSAVGCGGLMRAGSPDACDIEPALNDGISVGDSKFGVRTATATTTGTDPQGTLQPYPDSGYNDTTYALNYTAGDTAGVTSTFGDLFLDTDNAPANNQNMQLTFGVTVNNNTPAGLYSADLNLIATGKF